MTYSMPVTQKLKKMIKSLYQKQYREQNGLFVVEGDKMVSELLNSQNDIELVVVRESPSSLAMALLEKLSELAVPIYNAPKHVFDQMCDAKSPQSILAVTNLVESELNLNESFIALNGVSDPGNVGTIIRSADWFGFRQVILDKDCADKFNPKVLRSTMGSIFRVQVIQTDDLFNMLKNNFSQTMLFSADTNADYLLKSFRTKKNIGLIMGSEAHGISEELETLINKKFRIEGFGNAESLNVAVAAGISMYHFANIK